MDGTAIIAPTDSGLTEVESLEGKRIAALEGSGIESDLIRLLEAAEIDFELVPAQSLDQLMALVESGDADAYAASWLFGVTNNAQSEDLVVIPLEFSQGIAAFTAPNRPELGAAISEQMQLLIDDGSWAREFEASFGFTPPWTIEEMAAAG